MNAVVLIQETKVVRCRLLNEKGKKLMLINANFDFEKVEEKNFLEYIQFIINNVFNATRSA